MAEIRREITKGTWTIIAPTREDRPFDFSCQSSYENEKKVDEDCPFCPGNESETPKEVYAIREEEDDETGWKVRVFPNKFPALDSEGSSAVIEGDLFKSMGGFGHHEVLAETPSHDKDLVDLGAKEFELVVRAYLNRFEELGKLSEISYVSIFKNQGKRAGASLKHPHSQIMATTFVPSMSRREYEQAAHYWRNTGSCLYCDLIESETETGERRILENEHFVVICPYGSRFPYETRILPKRHSSDFGEITEEEIYYFGLTLKKTLSGLTEVLGKFPFNYTIHTAPTDPRECEIPTRESYHWHLEIMPRLTTPAGFERGTDNFINIVRPEKASKKVREAISN